MYRQNYKKTLIQEQTSGYKYCHKIIFAGSVGNRFAV
jgi:hypothetical protein